MARYAVTYVPYEEHVAVIEAADPAEAAQRGQLAWDDPKVEWLIQPWELSDYGEPVRVDVDEMEADVVQLRKEPRG